MPLTFTITVRRYPRQRHPRHSAAGSRAWSPPLRRPPSSPRLSGCGWEWEKRDDFHDWIWRLGHNKTVHGICLDDDFTASYGQVVLPLLDQSAEIVLFAHTRCRRFSWVIPEMTLDCQFILLHPAEMLSCVMSTVTHGGRYYQGLSVAFHGLLRSCWLLDSVVLTVIAHCVYACVYVHGYL
jgi:hypothetical protein